MKKPKGKKELLQPVEVDPEALENPYGAWLQEAMEESKFTVAKLVEKSGISAPAIYAILSGRSKNPQQETRRLLERAVRKQFAGADDKPKVEHTPNAVAPEGMGEFSDFDPYNDDLLPELPGIYVFYDISNRPIYVGKAVKGTRTIKSRVREHQDKFWFKRPLVESGAFIPIHDEVLCAQVEKALIKFLKDNAVINKHYVEAQR